MSLLPRTAVKLYCFEEFGIFSSQHIWYGWMLFNRLIFYFFFLVVVIFQVILRQSPFSWTRGLPIINHSLITAANSKMHFSRHSLCACWLQESASAILRPCWDFRGSAATEYLIKIAICRLRIAKCYLTMQKVLGFVFKLGKDLMFHPDYEREEENSALGCLALPPEVVLLSQILVKDFRERSRLRETCLFGV